MTALAGYDEDGGMRRVTEEFFIGKDYSNEELVSIAKLEVGDIFLKQGRGIDRSVRRCQ